MSTGTSARNHALRLLRIDVVVWLTLFALSLNVSCAWRSPDPPDVRTEMRKAAVRHAAESVKRDDALFQAAQSGDTDYVHRLLLAGAHIEAKNQAGETALAVAAFYGNADTVKLLLRAGADPVAGRLYGADVFIEAVRMGNSKKVKLLLQRGAGAKVRTEALFEACKSEHPVIMSGELPPLPAQPTGLPLFPGEGSAEIAKLLLDSGVSVESRDESGSTPLMLAAAFGATDIVELLLKRGANLEAKDKDGTTALHWAACDCAVIDKPDSFDSVKMLLEKGASINARDKNGLTPVRSTVAGKGS